MVQHPSGEVFALNNSIRVKFTRGEDVKYISHLDMMRAFERAIRRANIPIAYSYGFNPHPQMVFGLPLSVGVTSEAEYADFELSGIIEPEEFVKRLNMELPSGLNLLVAKNKETKTNIMATIAMASYEILIYSKELKENIIRDKINEFMQKAEIIIKKEGKGGVKNIDIWPMIQKLDVKIFAANKADGQQNADTCMNSSLMKYIDNLLNAKMYNSKYEIENIFCLSTLLNAGSVSNLKPDLLLTALNEVADLGINLLKIHRTGLLVSKGGKLLDPLDENALSMV